MTKYHPNKDLSSKFLIVLSAREKFNSPGKLNFCLSIEEENCRAHNAVISTPPPNYLLGDSIQSNKYWMLARYQVIYVYILVGTVLCSGTFTVYGIQKKYMCFIILMLSSDFSYNAPFLLSSFYKFIFFKLLNALYSFSSSNGSQIFGRVFLFCLCFVFIFSSLFFPYIFNFSTQFFQNNFPLYFQCNSSSMVTADWTGGEHLTQAEPIRFSYWESGGLGGYHYLFEVAIVEFMVVKKWDGNNDLQKEETELNTQRKVEMKDHIEWKKNTYEYERVRNPYGGIWKFSFDYFYFLHEIPGKVFSLE